MSQFSQRFISVFWIYGPQITASFALSIITIIGLISACIEFIRAMKDIQHQIWYEENLGAEKQHYYVSTLERETHKKQI